MLEENVDYELVPADNDMWHVRILKGEFVETVIRDIMLKWDNDRKTFNFSFQIETSPDQELTTSNSELQQTVADIIRAIQETELNASQ